LIVTNRRRTNAAWLPESRTGPDAGRRRPSDFSYASNVKRANQRGAVASVRRWRWRRVGAPRRPPLQLWLPPSSAAETKTPKVTPRWSRAKGSSVLGSPLSVNSA
jgi:hypothetical protein